MRLRRCAPSVRAVLVTLGVAAAVPIAAQAQEAPPDRERLTQFAKAHIAINGARDEFHLAAIVQNLKTLALRLVWPPPDLAAASVA